MARYREAVCRLCRREGSKLFLKGDRCFTQKCALERKAHIPGEQAHRMTRRPSQYALQLREKQKIKRIYGLLEKQFKRCFQEAVREKGITSENLLRLLECRLDNVVYRLGFAPSRRAARQLIRHRHFMVNDKVVDIPSYEVSPGDVVKVRDKSKRLEVITNSLKKSGRGRELPWLSVDKAELSGTLLNFPTREEIPIAVNERLVVELYSK
ncbi:MAG: 30S ribosomal protein S4 [Candidatus Latescibacterota bacterium]|nr:MAG: 30S ribosomal protein S4 [Candidatus Latescibacterota bacterium]RKY72940.1 MAG: 30S ribosomal protein S4 [Candidatus Latescibacterota bacterium]HDN67491.1 30S ribosomal protein S4 [Bacillota bacterium]